MKKIVIGLLLALSVISVVGCSKDVEKDSGIYLDGDCMLELRSMFIGGGTYDGYHFTYRARAFSKRYKEYIDAEKDGIEPQFCCGQENCGAHNDMSGNTRIILNGLQGYPAIEVSLKDGVYLEDNPSIEDVKIVKYDVGESPEMRVLIELKTADGHDIVVKYDGKPKFDGYYK